MLVREIEFAVFQPKVTATYWWKLRRKSTFWPLLGAGQRGPRSFYNISVLQYKVYQSRIKWLVFRGVLMTIHRLTQFACVLAKVSLRKFNFSKSSRN
jgi:hypothetical protein